jgi:hypothetical protein
MPRAGEIGKPMRKFHIIPRVVPVPLPLKREDAPARAPAPVPAPDPERVPA